MPLSSWTVMLAFIIIVVGGAVMLHVDCGLRWFSAWIMAYSIVESR